MLVYGKEQVEIHDILHSTAEQIVKEILFLSRHKNLQQKMMCVFLSKLQEILRTKMGAADCNILISCQEFIGACMKSSYIFKYVSDDDRRLLVKDATRECCKIMQIMCRNGMVIRSQDVQKLTVGVMYLMRSGVVWENEQILPRMPGVVSLLPPEPMLRSFFGIHPKCITEVENRLKFCLRRNV
jgi:hypothetical protein